jgi:hypothetical protein
LTSWPREIWEVGITTLLIERISRAAFPHGAVAAQSATTFAVVRLASEWMCSGFPGFTTIARVLRVKIVAEPTMSPAFCAPCMSFIDADANTSAGAPCSIWVARVLDEAKLNAIEVPRCALWKRLPNWVNTPVSDEAADTVIEPVSVAALALTGAAARAEASENEAADAQARIARAHGTLRVASRLMRSPAR